jgi:N-acetylmuramoyl-L-alanine amidase
MEITEFLENLLSMIGVPMTSFLTKPPTVQSNSNQLSIASNFAIIVGHNEKSQGAVNYLNETEFVFNKRIANKLQVKLLEKTFNSHIIYRPTSGGYTYEVNSVVAECKKLNIKYAIELHFNSIAGTALGCEVLITDSKDEKDNQLANIITDLLNEKLGIKERGFDGVVVVSEQHRGSKMLYSLKNAGILSCIVEPCFANIKTKESSAIFENEDKYVDILAESILKVIK